MFCTRCGAKLDDTTAPCPHCGQEKGAQVSAPDKQPVSAPDKQPEVYVQVTDDRAIASLVLGILGLFFSIVAGIPAIILGRRSLAQIKQSPENLAGESMAKAGLILGYISIALVPLLLIIAIPNLTHSKSFANEAAAAANMRTLNTVQSMYLNDYPKAGYAPDLATLGPGGAGCISGEGTQKNACLLDNSLGCPAGTSGKWCQRDEYRYGVVGISNSGRTTDYIVTATPVNPSSGSVNYCESSDSGLRSHSGPPLSEPVKTAEECKGWQQL